MMQVRHIAMTGFGRAIDEPATIQGAANAHLYL